MTGEYDGTKSKRVSHMYRYVRVLLKSYDVVKEESIESLSLYRRIL